MKVAEPRVLQTGSLSEVSAEIDGFRLFYRWPGDAPPVAPRGDSFLVASLIPAMARGEALEIDAALPVSPALLEGADRIQDVLHLWNPQLRKVTVHGSPEPAPAPHPGVASFYSGGADGGYTLLKHRDEITDLILIHGLDISPDNESRFTEISSRIQAVAQTLGKNCIPVACNAQGLCEHAGITMALFHGALLASIALILGRRRTYIPSTLRYHEPQPWGSHILLDEHWSTESCQIVHDGGEASRAEKIRRIAGCEPLLDSLRVCNSTADLYNCGQCEKCLRTMVTLRILRVASKSLPSAPVKELMEKLVLHNELHFQFLCQNYEMALQTGDADAARELRSRMRNYELKRLLKELDGVLLGGRLNQLYRSVRPGASSSTVIGVDGRQPIHSRWGR